MQLAYYVTALYQKPLNEAFDEDDCEAQRGVVVVIGEDPVLVLCTLESAISNFDTVTTPTPIIFFQDLGTTAPPGTLGGQTMGAFGDDDYDDGSSVSALSSPSGGDLAFSPNVVTASVPATWTTWSHGYTGRVYSQVGTSLTMTLPAGTTAFHFYAEPNVRFISEGVRASFDFTVTTSNGETVVVSSGNVPIEGDAGARGFGFYTSNTTIATITVTTVEAAGGFAVGEFGIAGDGEIVP